MSPRYSRRAQWFDRLLSIYLPWVDCRGNQKSSAYFRMLLLPETAKIRVALPRPCSAQSVLPHCCAASHKPSERSDECGRWATSSFQMHDPIPSELLAKGKRGRRCRKYATLFIFSSYEGGTCRRNLSTPTP